MSVDFWTLHYSVLLAVSTRPPAGDLSRFTLEFSQPLWASVRIFISYRAARSIVSAVWASVRRIYALRARMLSALAGLCKEFY